MEKRLSELDEVIADARQQRTDARRALDHVTDAATAADQEQDAEAALGRTAALVSEYARTAVAAEILRRTIAEYGERHRGPLLHQAATVFTQLTDGAFATLETDHDGQRQELLAVRPNGERCRPREMSDGTRDQLYLALRLAGMEHQVRALAEPLPVVLDDILVHFDDSRSAAALRVLGQLGSHTQVLLFTHHLRVVELATQELGEGQVDVVHLEPRHHEPRHHELLPHRSGAPQADDGALWGSGAGGAGTGGPGAASSEAGAQAQIRAALRVAGGGPLGKAEILARSGVTPEEWPAAVRALLRGGVLAQEGQKRGARYHLVE